MAPCTIKGRDGSGNPPPKDQASRLLILLEAKGNLESQGARAKRIGFPDTSQHKTCSLQLEGLRLNLGRTERYGQKLKV